MITDKNLLINRFASNLTRYNSLAVVQDQICDQLAEMIARHCGDRKIVKAMEIGSGTGFLTRRLVAQLPDAEWFINDIVPQSARFVAPIVGERKVEYIWGDAEKLEIPLDLDLIASASTVQWFDSLNGFIAKAAKSLDTSGILALSTFGANNFIEIKTVTGQGLQYYSPEQIGEMLNTCGLEVLQVQEYSRKLYFSSPLEVLKHIKYTGVNSLRRERWGKRELFEFEQQYRDLFSDSTQTSAAIQNEAQSTQNVVSLTYNPILIIARK